MARCTLCLIPALFSRKSANSVKVKTITRTYISLVYELLILLTVLVCLIIVSGIHIKCFTIVFERNTFIVKPDNLSNGRI